MEKAPLMVSSIKIRDYSTLLCIAETIAKIAHYGEFRRDGVTPYITHPLKVLRDVQDHRPVLGNRSFINTYAEIVALVHDCWESKPDLPPPEDFGFPNEICEAVKAITHDTHTGKAVSYDEYLAIVKANPIALMVKLEDIKANLSDDPTEKQKIKYAAALEFLLKK